MKGKTYEQFRAGDRYETGRRTITEHDILQFVTLVGLTEPLFLDMEYIRNESLFGERIADRVLVLGAAAGMGAGFSAEGAALDQLPLAGSDRVLDQDRVG